jgi:hypothetical protein
MESDWPCDNLDSYNAKMNLSWLLCFSELISLSVGWEQEFSHLRYAAGVK